MLIKKLLLILGMCCIELLFWLQDLLMLLSVCQRLVNDAAEAAYMAGKLSQMYSSEDR